jgi:hypothetical protein
MERLVCHAMNLPERNYGDSAHSDWRLKTRGLESMCLSLLAPPQGVN